MTVNGIASVAVVAAVVDSVFARAGLYKGFEVAGPSGFRACAVGVFRLASWPEGATRRVRSRKLKLE